MFKLISRILRLARSLSRLEDKVERLQQAVGRVELRQVAAYHPQERKDPYGVRVFSQWEEDGILDGVIGRLHSPIPFFVEFGVENYRESNTRFLAENRNWIGVVLDGSSRNVEDIRSQRISWARTVRAASCFVTAENIEQLFESYHVPREFGLLSIDIDGNDLWVWKAITSYRPQVVAIEYNWRFGPERSLSTPYDPAFDRIAHHYSGIRYGASVAALAKLGKEKGYVLIDGNSQGNNAFFIREDLLAGTGLVEQTPAQVYRQGTFREARNPDGTLALLTAQEEIELFEAGSYAKL